MKGYADRRDDGLGRRSGREYDVRVDHESRDVRDLRLCGRETEVEQGRARMLKIVSWIGTSEQVYVTHGNDYECDSGRDVAHGRWYAGGPPISNQLLLSRSRGG